MLNALKVPVSVQRNARKGLELRKFYGRGGTPIGEASAKKLSSGKISLKFAKHVANYFPRHAGDNLEQTEKSEKGPSNGYIAWLLWGGSAARDWLKRGMKVNQNNKSKAKQNPRLTSDKSVDVTFKILHGTRSGNTEDDYDEDGRSVLSGPPVRKVTLKRGSTGDTVVRRIRGGQDNHHAMQLMKRWYPKFFVKAPKASSFEALKKNPFFMDAFHAGETFQKDKSANRTPRYASFAEWWKAKGSKDAGAKFFDAEDAKDFWVMGVNSMKSKSKNPSKAGLPANASAQQIYAKMKQLSTLKSTLEDKGTRKDFVKAERIGQQMKALAKKHQQVLQLTVGKNPSLKRGLKAIKSRVSSIAKRVTSKAKASLKKLTPSGRRSLAAIKRLHEASKTDPLGKTKRTILEMRKSSLKANPSALKVKLRALHGSKAAAKRMYRDSPQLWKTLSDLDWQIEDVKQAIKASLKAKNPRLYSKAAGTRTHRYTVQGGPSTATRVTDSFAAVKKLVAAMVKAKPHEWVTVYDTKTNTFPIEYKGPGSKSNPKRKTLRKPSTKRKRNSASASSALYEKFHGKPSTSILEIEEEWHIHKNLAQLGTLVEIKVLLNPTESKTNQRRATLAVPHSDNPLKGVQLCSSENAKKTLYFVGGDQSLPLKALGFTAADEKDLMYIGEIEEITYRTRKHFDQFKKIDYYHGLGEVSKVRPQLLYRSRDKKLLIAGGQYDVRPEGIVN